MTPSNPILRMGYPTREEIETELTRPNTLEEQECINGLAAWRADLCHMKPNMEALAVLVHALRIGVGCIRSENISFDVLISDLYAFNPRERIVMLEDGNPSIISTLHETAHALYGSSELQACQFSIRLFKAVYPKAFAKLVWEGHMLKRPVRAANVNA